ncbi:hypothetical protein N473_07020 [Pseudoalteromonas luteoviolacea CPMOR-1]|uniref:Uncharacterized protein n=1 Tax=Pseudoalteromonas luteoviolacea CPMOR-1 TaxID=1365248 RepID=A0A167H4E3_9GAMM|nr:hypothetical protein [Pseudoalteromonas luteoviolacea]KZN57620.1 hypothetical protein N473_07020 [Pseudoalteromonas luteoviolacea CPMOR-1]
MFSTLYFITLLVFIFMIIRDATFLRGGPKDYASSEAETRHHLGNKAFTLMIRRKNIERMADSTKKYEALVQWNEDVETFYELCDELVESSNKSQNLIKFPIVK